MTEIPVPIAPAFDTKSFNGNYLLWRKSGQKLRKGMPGGGGSPRFRHPSFAAAETEAVRLLGLFPESSFVILQEVARVKLKDLGVEISRQIIDPEAVPEGATVAVDVAYDPRTKSHGWGVYRNLADGKPDPTAPTMFCGTASEACSTADALSAKWGIPIVMEAANG